jgi:hypothetical protein
MRMTFPDQKEACEVNIEKESNIGILFAKPPETVERKENIHTPVEP